MRLTVTEPNTGTACKTLRLQVPIYPYNLTTSLRLTNRMDTSIQLCTASPARMLKYRRFPGNNLTSCRLNAAALGTIEA